MKLFKWVIFLQIVFTSSSFGQDTVSIYFKSGKSNIQESQFQILNAIPSQFDLSELDSVNYIGITDSVGDLKSNLKLSKKRALEAIKYCEQLFPKNYAFKITALGEKSKNEENLNRRVDIVLYYKPITKADIAGQVETTELIKGCYYIDYKLLHRSHKRIISNKKIEFVMIEVNMNELKKINQHYYATQTKNGEIIIKKIKWSPKKTGNNWWANYRYVAIIPKTDFDRFKIFKTEEPPCNDCSEDFKTKKETLNVDDCMQLDRFLMANIQIKPKLFERRFVQIRAPREFVDFDGKYFIGCSYERPLFWDIKNGRRNKNYYYAKLPVLEYYLENIVRKMSCCKSNPEPSECDKHIIRCATFGQVDKSFILTAEIGDHYQFDKNIPYVGIGISKAGNYSQAMWLIGTDSKLNLYSALRYQFNFISFPFRILNPFSVWQNPNSVDIIYRYARLYIGSELKTRLNNSKSNLLEQNVHLGISAVNAAARAFIPRIFVQCGLGYDYFQNYSTKPYLVLQAGINMRLAKLGKQK